MLVFVLTGLLATGHLYGAIPLMDATSSALGRPARRGRRRPGPAPVTGAALRPRRHTGEAARTPTPTRDRTP
ncbi:hypothetical protein [Microtetraspora niveoalba]|uniref:hypothetical protein n=1 Tax=Microtetraspora niveoalba TaxID=46175 RepID=UPI00082EB68B|nr:hypothetical protein [Microtetraspora niveoalba]